MRIACFVPGNLSIFAVDIDEQRWVADLKEGIRNKKPNKFNNVDADELTLYRVEVDTPCDEQKRIDELEQLSRNLNGRTKLDSEQVLSGLFGESPPQGKKYYVLVQVPEAAPTAAPKTPPPRPQASYKNEAAVWVEIQDFITETLHHRIRDFLTKPYLTTWVPPKSVDDDTRRFYNDLQIPLVNNKPSLLLHDLGVTPNPNADNLFRGRNHRILCNTSGAGKTRLLLEGLSQRWGFYFVIAQGADCIGTRDFEDVLEGMALSTGWSDNAFKDQNSGGVPSPKSRNRAIASEGLSKVILARWVVFQTFIQVASELDGGMLRDNLQRDWLLFQVLPLYKTDAFSALIEQVLRHVQPKVLDSLCSQFSPSSVLGSSFNSTTDSFFYVIDEAQVAGELYMGAFADQAGTTERPVLRPIIQQMMRSAHTGTTVIISGTGFSLELFRTVMTSGVAKSSSSFDVVYTTGDFSELATQSLYISRYLPVSFLASDSGTHLKTRVYNWLRGRHRFTVSFLEELMMGSWHKDRPASPHKLLNAYVRRLTDFTPLDSNEMILGEEDASSVAVDTFQWDKIEKRPKLLDELAHSIYSFIMRGEPPMWWSEQESLVEYGVARFSRKGEGAGSKVTIEEPLALISIMRHFESKSRTLGGHFRTSLQLNQGIAFEEAVLFAMTKLLQNQRPLSSIFNFYGEPPSWAVQTAQIVARKSSGDFEAFTIDEFRNTRSTFAYSAKGPEEVQCWLESSENGWCIPDTQMGADLMARLRLSNGAFLLLVIQAKCRTTSTNEYMKPDVLAGAIRSLIPSRFFHSLITMYRVNKTKQLEKAQNIESMLGAINLGDRFTGLQYNILRVVAAFPLDANFESVSEVVQAAIDEDGHPLAKLSQVILTAELATCPDGKSFVNLLKGKLKRAHKETRSDDEAEEDGPNAKRRKGVKRSFSVL